MNEPTNKNHYIPCFWLALWNEKYYHLKILDHDAPKPRTQTLYVLKCQEYILTQMFSVTLGLTA